MKQTTDSFPIHLVISNKWNTKWNMFIYFILNVNNYRGTLWGQTPWIIPVFPPFWRPDCGSEYWAACFPAFRAQKCLNLAKCCAIMMGTRDVISEDKLSARASADALNCCQSKPENHSDAKYYKWEQILPRALRICMWIKEIAQVYFILLCSTV